MEREPTGGFESAAEIQADKLLAIGEARGELAQRLPRIAFTVMEDEADSRISAVLERGYIILFDAECVLCSTNAQFVLTHDTARRFYLAPMQGSVGASLFRQHGLNPEDPTSILVIGKSEVHKDSDAILAIYEKLGWPWRLVSALRIIPAFVRDPAYRLIARHRYRFFGKRTECWVPAEADRARML